MKNFSVSNKIRQRFPTAETSLTSFGLWVNKSYDLNSRAAGQGPLRDGRAQLLSVNLIYNILSLFWEDIMEKLPAGSKMKILFRIKWEDGSIVTLGKALTVTLSDFTLIYSYLEGMFGLKDNTYRSYKAIRIIISYHIIKSEDNSKVKKSIPNVTKLNQPSSIIKDQSTIKGLNHIPSNMNFKSWGPVTNVANSTVDNTTTYTINKKGVGNYIFEVLVHNVTGLYHQEVKVYTNNKVRPNVLLLEFDDQALPIKINQPQITKFTRYLPAYRQFLSYANGKLDSAE